MAFDKNKVIHIAEAEVGYREKASNAGLDIKEANAGAGNWNKYARDLDRISGFYNGAKNGYAWCDIFVDWCFVKAYGVVNAKKLLCQPDYSAGAGCLYSAQYYKNHGRWRTIPQPGYQIFFSYRAGEVSHTGLVVAIDGSTVRTVEGNTSDGVFYRTYSMYDPRIYGYGAPDYDMNGSDEVPSSDTPSGPSPVIVIDKQPSIPCKVVLDLELLKPNYSGNSPAIVKIMQRQLMLHGYKLPKYGADGDFGEETKIAFGKFQEDHHLVKDYECGQNSWRALFMEE